MTACVGTGNYYVLSTAKEPVVKYAKKSSSIGVEKVKVPKYLLKDELAIAKTSSKISLVHGAVWGEKLNIGLTQRLIGFLQKKFNQPSVYGYPWGLDRQPDIKIKVQVNRFIAQGDRVYLDANWEVENMQNHKSKAYLFSTSVPTANSDAENIVDAMDRAFGEFEEEVARGVQLFH